MPNENRIFLAHAREDKPHVRGLYDRLKERGFEPWLDEEDLLGGQLWKDEIRKAIADAGVFLACLSKRSVDKVGYVQNEFRRALTAFGERPPGSIFFIPVRLDECDVPDIRIPDLELSLRDIHWIDLFDEKGLDRLVLAIEQALEGKSPTTTLSTPTKDSWPDDKVDSPIQQESESKISIQREQRAEGGKFQASEAKPMGKLTVIIISLIGIIATIAFIRPTLLDWLMNEDVAEPKPRITFSKSSATVTPVPNPASEYSVIRDCPDCPEMVMLPADMFLRGSLTSERKRVGNEGPRHEVTISKPFALGKYEVTFAEYDRFADATDRERPSDGGWGRGRYPVINVSWNDAAAYCSWLGREVDQIYRLPTEAEWEYAARAGTTTPFSFGETISTDQANYDGRNPYARASKGAYRKKTVAVNFLPANSWGLHQMHGNVWEWVLDWYGKYPTGSVTDPEGPATGNWRIIRGGSWFDDASLLRSAGRAAVTPDRRDSSLGFRCARIQGA